MYCQQFCTFSNKTKTSAEMLYRESYAPTHTSLRAAGTDFLFLFNYAINHWTHQEKGGLRGKGKKVRSNCFSGAAKSAPNFGKYRL